MGELLTYETPSFLIKMLQNIKNILQNILFRL